MSFYSFNGDNTLGGRRLRSGLDNLRDGRQKVKEELAVMNQMTATQMVARYQIDGVDQAAKETAAAAMKSEIAADIAAMEGNGGTVALDQMFAELG